MKSLTTVLAALVAGDSLAVLPLQPHLRSRMPPARGNGAVILADDGGEASQVNLLQCKTGQRSWPG
jgi:hypothetical protein